MPYSYKKQGDEYIVYKKGTKTKVGSTKGDKESLRKYLAALHINAMKNETKITEQSTMAPELREMQNSIKALLKDLNNYRNSAKIYDNGKGIAQKLKTVGMSLVQAYDTLEQVKNLSNESNNSPSDIIRQEIRAALKEIDPDGVYRGIQVDAKKLLLISNFNEQASAQDVQDYLKKTLKIDSQVTPNGKLKVLAPIIDDALQRKIKTYFQNRGWGHLKVDIIKKG